MCIENCGSIELSSCDGEITAEHNTVLDLNAWRKANHGSISDDSAMTGKWQRHGKRLVLASAMLSGSLGLISTGQAAALEPPPQEPFPWETETSDRDSAPQKCEDSDGDGYGWDGNATCEMDGRPDIAELAQVADEQRQELNEQRRREFSEAVQNDIGENLDQISHTVSETIRPDNNKNDDAKEQPKCEDSDGDGWGWTGDASCLMGNNPYLADLSHQVNEQRVAEARESQVELVETANIEIFGDLEKVTEGIEAGFDQTKFDESKVDRNATWAAWEGEEDQWVCRIESYGYGYDGVGTCLLPELVEPDPATVKPIRNYTPPVVEAPPLPTKDNYMEITDQACSDVFGGSRRSNGACVVCADPFIFDDFRDEFTEWGQQTDNRAMECTEIFF